MSVKFYFLNGIDRYIRQVAVSAIREFLENHEMEAYLVVFDKAAFTVSENILGEVASFIDEHYVDIHTNRRRSRNLLDVEIEALQASDVPMNFAPASDLSEVLDEWVGHLDEPSSHTLLRLIDAKGKTDIEVYKRANTASYSLRFEPGKGICLASARLLPLP